MKRLLVQQQNFTIKIDVIIPGKYILLLTFFYAVVIGSMLQASVLEKEAPKSTTITLYWTATGDNGLAGRASFYDLRYSLAPITTYNWNNAHIVENVPAPKYSGSAESFRVYGLTPNTTYFFAIKVGDAFPNWSDISNVVMLRTAEPPICGDLDESGVVDIADLVSFVGYIFIDGTPSYYLKALDLDLSGKVDINDIIKFVEYLFINGGSLYCQ